MNVRTATATDSNDASRTEEEITSVWDKHWRLKRRLLLFASLVAPAVVIASKGAWWAWVYAACAHSALLNGMVMPTSNWLGPILNRLPTRRKEVWLTIDDGPSADTIPLAQMLYDKGITATFFFRGDAVDQFPGAVREVAALGHTIANHTTTHPLPLFWMFSPMHVAREIDRCAEKIRSEGVDPLPWFRCPAGVKNPFLHPVLRRRGLTLLGWTVRAFDGIVCNVERSKARILARLVPGAILLVHEGKKDYAGQSASLRFIESLVSEIERRGFKFVSANATLD